MSEEVTYIQYLNRLIEWSTDYVDYVGARAEFDDLLRGDLTQAEAFEIVKTLRTSEWPQRQ